MTAEERAREIVERVNLCSVIKELWPEIWANPTNPHHRLVAAIAAAMPTMPQAEIDAVKEALKFYANGGDSGNQWVNGVRTNVYFGDPQQMARQALKLVEGWKSEKRDAEGG